MLNILKYFLSHLYLVYLLLNNNKLHWGFEIKTDHLRQPDLIIFKRKIKKITCRILGFPIPVDHCVKLKECEKKDKYLNLARELKTAKHESDGDTSCNWCSWCNHRRISRGIGGPGNKRTKRDHRNYCIIEIGQNTEKSPGDLRRFVLTQTPVICHQLTLMWKTFKV